MARTEGTKDEGLCRPFVMQSSHCIFVQWVLTANQTMECVLREESTSILSTLCLPSAAIFVLDGQQISWISCQMKDSNSKEFRCRMIQAFSVPKMLTGCSDKDMLKLYFLVVNPVRPILDKLGNMMSNSYVSVKCEMETALSWLSTLGGAFSALGDISTNYAVEAGQVSLKQLKIALKLKDPLIEARCRLYMALSLTQLGRLEDARDMVIKEYAFALLKISVDSRLRKMCLGVWCKLQYTWKLRRLRRKFSNNPLVNNAMILERAKSKNGTKKKYEFAEGKGGSL